ncbi:MAG TPA: MarR family transcriptional regulator [Nocardia sp.]|uniref:MarR family transcriptional regulator n=1 Tax=Nocardia TaxID=1817 RepID=UPI002457308D|nr:MULTISPECIES: MarR family transcriptional regulator [Nocardia]HLS78526.1 MarR family transcriptional regulator [Nocardia sp.]
MSELDLLQAVRLKGRARAADLAATAGLPEADGSAELARLAAAGLVEGKSLLRITPAGRERLDALLAEERAGADSAAISVLYSAFRAVNADFKALVVDWQLKDGEPNPHTDADYDAAVLARLAEIHERVVPILDSAAVQIPRLARYTGKLADALTEIRAGDHSWFTKPIADSYHTVWFELHEELILAAGLTREAEARAGHAH